MLRGAFLEALHLHKDEEQRLQDRGYEGTRHGSSAQDDSGQSGEHEMDAGWANRYVDQRRDEHGRCDH
jgi:hypothetical protein